MKNRTEAGSQPVDLAFDAIAKLPEPAEGGRAPGTPYDPEGRFVRVVGYAAAFGRADGEPCNCNKGASKSSDAARFVDLHVRLTASRTDADLWAREPGRALTAEATPRLMSTTCRDRLLGGPTAEQVPGLEALLRLGVPDPSGLVRLTGWLFADDDKGGDSAHGDEDGDGKRLTVWEVHPLFRIEACAGGECAPGADAGWRTIWSARNPATGNDSCP